MPDNLMDTAASPISAAADTPDASTRADDVLVTSATVRETLGNCSDMTIWRKLKHDPDFPRPKVMAGRRFWWQSDILAYIERQPI